MQSSRTERATGSVFASIYLFAPVIAAPLWAWLAGSWWLLCAIPATWLGVALDKLAALLLIALLISAGVNDWHWTTVLPFSLAWALFGAVFSRIASEYLKKDIAETALGDVRRELEASGHLRIDSAESEGGKVNELTAGPAVAPDSSIPKFVPASEWAEGSTNSTMTFGRAHQLFDRFIDVVARGMPDDECFRYRSSLPATQLELVQAIKLQLATDIASGKKTPHWPDDVTSVAFDLPSFVADTDARRMNAAYRLWRRDDAPIEEQSRAYEVFSQFKMDRDIEGLSFRVELNAFIGEVEKLDPIDASFEKVVFLLAGIQSEGKSLSPSTNQEIVRVSKMIAARRTQTAAGVHDNDTPSARE